MGGFKPFAETNKAVFEKIRKKEKEFKQLLMKMTFDTLVQQAQEYQKLLLDAAKRFRFRAEEILDEIAEFEERLPTAREAFKSGRLDRGKNGNYKDEDTTFVLIMSAEAKGLSLEVFTNMSDEELFNFATDAFNSPDLVRNYKANEYEIVSKIADVMEKHGLKIGEDFKTIMNDDQLNERQKEEQIKELFDENITDIITEELSTLDIQNHALMNKVLDDLSLKQYDEISQNGIEQNIANSVPSVSPSDGLF